MQQGGSGRGMGQFDPNNNQAFWMTGTGTQGSMSNFTMNNNNSMGVNGSGRGQESDSWLPHQFAGVGSSIGAPRAAPVTYHQAATSNSNSPLFSEYTASHSSSQEANFADSESSSRLPSQGSDYYCPASPTYEWSLPRMSPVSSQGSAQNSQTSWGYFPDSPPNSQGASPIAWHEIDFPPVFFTGTLQAEQNRSGSGSQSTSQSQPSFKRMRYEY